MPQLSGMEVPRRLRRTSSVPIIMLTARDSVVDKVSGLDSGANDYITKPFAIEELLARIRTALRKNRQEDGVLSASGLLLDTGRHTVTMMGKSIELTKREFDLLHYLLKNKGLVVSRETLLEHVWGFDFAVETNAVDVYVRFLRGKIDEVFDMAGRGDRYIVPVLRTLFEVQTIVVY